MKKIDNNIELSSHFLIYYISKIYFNEITLYLLYSMNELLLDESKRYLENNTFLYKT